MAILLYLKNKLKYESAVIMRCSLIVHNCMETLSLNAGDNFSCISKKNKQDLARNIKIMCPY